VTHLVRAVSKLGLASRAQARALIAAGRVAVNGRVVRDPLAPVDLSRAAIAVDDQIGAAAPRMVLALHKPRGVVTTRSDPQGRPTVYSLISDAPPRLVPAGRLDLATTGLLLFTNDTRFADWVTDPESAVPKVYLVTVRGRVKDETLARLQAGVLSGASTLAPDAVTLRKASGRESHLVVTLTEGKNREVRRLCDAVGHEVTQLRRVQIGGLELGRLAPGAWRMIDEAELRRSFPAFPDFGAQHSPDSRQPIRDSRPATSRAASHPGRGRTATS
jgi:23S rRNA pseudouridine2605 synthase